MTTGYEYDQKEMEEAIKKSKSRRESEKRGSSFYSIEEGQDNIFRLLPPPSGSPRKLPFIESSKHFMQYKDKEGNLRYAVLNCTLDKHGVCPICSHVKELRNKAQYTKNEADKKAFNKAAGQMKVNLTYLYTALNEANEIGILEMPARLQDNLLDQFENMQKIGGKNFVNVFDVQRGRHVIMKKEKKFKNNTSNYEWVYTVTFFPTESSLPEAIIANYDKLYVHPENFIRDYSPADLEKALAGDFSFMQKKQEEDLPELDPTKVKAKEEVAAPVQEKKVEKDDDDDDDGLAEGDGDNIDDILNS